MKSPTVEFFEQLGIENITVDDSFEIRYHPHAQFLKVTVHQNGTKIVAMRELGDRFDLIDTPVYDTIEKRNFAICRMCAQGVSRSDVAAYMGMSQSMVSIILKDTTKCE